MPEGWTSIGCCQRQWSSLGIDHAAKYKTHLCTLLGVLEHHVKGEQERMAFTGVRTRIYLSIIYVINPGDEPNITILFTAM